MKKRFLSLPNAELEVIQVLWEQDTATVRDIRERLEQKKQTDVIHATIVTLLRRLEEKGHVEKTGEKVGKAFVYRAVLQPERVQKKVIRDFVSRHFGNDPIPLVSYLIENSDLKLDEIQHLRTALDKLEDERGE